MTKLFESENWLQAIGKRMVLKPAAFTELINCWVIIGLPQLVSPPTASSELPTFQPIPINLVSATLLTPPAELARLLELEERDDERLDELNELERLEELIELDLLEDRLELMLTLERLEELNELDRLELMLDREELEDRLELIDEEEREDDVTEPPHMLPVTTGVSIAPLPLTCIPKATVCPGCMLPFQLRLVAL
jgi:hypothetical protein